MNVLSLFDGISAGRLALGRAGINVKTYYRSEIDKYASQVAMHHFPNDVQLGDVTKWREWNIDWSSIDLLIGGSPCQGFSFAGKQAGTKAVLDGTEIIVTDRETYLELKDKGAEFLSQSHLFWEYVLILDYIKAHNPDVKFMLENVKMKKELLEMISTALGVKDVVINSSLVSAQNRHRHYWCNWEVTQPEDKGILLRDILEYGGSGCTYNRKDGLGKSLEKSLSLCASDWRGLNRNQNQTAIIKVGNINPSGRGMNGNVFHADGKCPTLTTNKGEGIKITGGAIRGRYNEDGSTSQKLEVNDTGRTNALTTVQKDNVVVYHPASIVGRRLNDRGVRDDYNKDIPITQCLQVKHSNEKTGCLTTVDKDNVLSLEKPGRYKDIYNRDDIHYRKLTPTECARLQTFPDGWCESVVSNSQSYKAYGNSWTVDVIAHILEQAEL